MTNQETERAIGIFDSGLGGLTVVRALREALPGEHLVYLGDTARVPYGTKSGDTVVRYSLQIASFLLDKGIKYLLVACNTASAHALDALRREVPVPCMGVVEPGARVAVETTRTGQVGVIGTQGTIESGAYHQAIHRHNPALSVHGLPCGLLVPLAEEGWLDHPITEQIAGHYLTELRTSSGDLDTIVLGCTHYPLLKPLLARQAERIFGHPVALVDSAEAVSRAVADDLKRLNLLRTASPAAPDTVEQKGTVRLFFTDVCRFGEVAERFMGKDVPQPEQADL